MKALRRVKTTKSGPWLPEEQFRSVCKTSICLEHNAVHDVNPQSGFSHDVEEEEGGGKKMEKHWWKLNIRLPV